MVKTLKRLDPLIFFSTRCLLSYFPPILKYGSQVYPIISPSPSFTVPSWKYHACASCNRLALGKSRAIWIVSDLFPPIRRRSLSVADARRLPVATWFPISKFPVRWERSRSRPTIHVGTAGDLPVKYSGIILSSCDYPREHHTDLELFHHFNSWIFWRW